MIQSVTTVAPKNQKLICKGKILQDAQVVGDTKVTPGSKMTLMGKK